MSARKMALSLAISLIFGLSALASAQDAVEATPGIYKVLHENRDVRILELTYQPGQAENWHSHPRYFVYVVEPGRMKIENEKGEIREVDLKSGQNLLVGPIARHRVTNTSDHIVRLISVEFKSE